MHWSKAYTPNWSNGSKVITDFTGAIKKRLCSSSQQDMQTGRLAKTDSLKNSPLFYMRRRLNGKPGKEYGERNRTYRENFDIA